MKINIRALLLVCICWGCACPAVADNLTPRFAAIRNNQVNMRTGPGEKYPIKWVYKEKHFPVEIIDEYEKVSLTKVFNDEKEPISLTDLRVSASYCVGVNDGTTKTYTDGKVDYDLY